jgi:protease I
MKSLVKKLSTLLLTAGLILAAGIQAETGNREGKKVAVLVAEGFHDAETLSPVFHLREHNIKAVFLSTAKGAISAYNSEVVIEIETTLADVDADEFDAVIVPGGRSPAVLREDGNVLRFVREFSETGRPIAGICHGPQVLASAGLVEGVELTGFGGIADEMKEAGANFVDREVVIDGQFITSRLPGDLSAFNRAIVEALRE